MEVKVQQWGNSAAIRLPATVLKLMNVVSGDILQLDVATDVITLKPAKAKPHYHLSELMAQCDLSAPEPAELAGWEVMPAVGREA